MRSESNDQNIFRIIGLILFIVVIPVLIIVSLELGARQVEEASFNKITPQSFLSRKQNLGDKFWKLADVKTCISENFPPYNSERKPLVPKKHLLSQDTEGFSHYRNDLHLYGGAFRGPRTDAETIIGVFGGSTIAGDGLECDEYTLPSALGRYAQNEHLSFQNRGHSAYNSFESTNYFLQLIKKEEHLSQAWFIEGVNDVIRKVVLGKPSYHYSATAIGLSEKISTRSILLESLASRSALYRRLINKWPVLNSSIVEGPNLLPTAIVDFAKISQKEHLAYRAKVAALTTLEDYKFIQKLAKWNDIEVRFFLQPSVFDRVNLTDVESKIIKIMESSYPNIRLAYEYYALNLKKLAPEMGVAVIDVRDCVAGANYPIYFDSIHLSPLGNDLLAQCILKKLDD